MKAAPPLQRRVMLTMISVIVALFVLIFGVITYGALKRGSGDLDRAFLTSAQSLARSLEGMSSDEGVQSTSRLFQSMIADQTQADPRGEPPIELRVARRDGGLHVPPLLAGDIDPLMLADGVSQQVQRGLPLRTYTATGTRWKVSIVDDSERRQRWVLRDVARDLLGYMLLSLPIILLPVWLALRAALAPLRRLSDSVAVRAPDDMSPLQLDKPYRELLPLQAALNRLFERVAASLAHEKAFVHDAAHELRTPLAVISTQAHVLQTADGPARVDAARRLQGAVARASHLTQQLLRLAQADALALAPRETVDVMNIARDTLAGFAEQAAAQGSELSLAGPDSAVLATDPRALRSMLGNLVDNALRYGGAGVAVSVGFEIGPRDWVLRVVDDGPGIPVEHRQQAFERFWRGQAADQRGAGLGLAIVREAALSLGGQVSVQGGPGSRGCAFAVSLPRH
ncbi:Histidine kinase domain-containing protein [Rubrivivax sp. A210]|uniref:sensor histidine kinase n=1 Tax=Rubrivivax sp. A210 TaxID=2772301 RepID=UPI00191B84F5|nr:HAMP domain-containing sensor histidine kinase [Rubrivivax sp. A210]CAD5367011.1 Histidine kinase domain-containing protein [Rubrivivax sp. A210]